MRCNHDNFVRAIRDKMKVKLTFCSEERRGRPSLPCGPIIFSPQVAGEDSACYYFWDFESHTGGSLLVLSPSQIASMELTNEPFDLEAFFTVKQVAGEPESDHQRTKAHTDGEQEDGERL